MTAALYVAVGLAAWFLVGTVVAVVVGRTIALADREQAQWMREWETW